MAKDIIYKKTVNFDKENKFSIDLTSNNQIEKNAFLKVMMNG